MVVVPEIVAVGKAITVMVTAPVCAWLQLGVVAEDTLTKVYVLSAVNVAVGTVTVPVASKTAVWLPTPSLYVTVAFGVPVKVTEPAVLKQIVGVVVEIATVGKANTFTVADPV